MVVLRLNTAAGIYEVPVSWGLACALSSCSPASFTVRQQSSAACIPEANTFERAGGLLIQSTRPCPVVYRAARGSKEAAVAVSGERMKRYLDSSGSSREKTAANRRQSAAAAAGPNKTRLSTLLEKPKPAPATGLDVSLIDSLSVGGGEPAAKRSRRLSHSSGGGGGGAADSFAEAECLDVTASPPRAAATATVAAGRKSGGGGRASDSVGGRVSRSSCGGAGSNGRGGGSAGKGGGNSGANNNRGGGGGGSSGGGGGVKRNNGSAANAAGWSGGAGRSSNGSSNKMGPWARRPEETAICAEEGYDPLELMDDANREIFGNDAFRGIQEDVRAKFVEDPVPERAGPLLQLATHTR